MANQEKSNGLNNLKTIYKIQAGGELQELLRDLRSTKRQVEDLLSLINREKKAKASENTEINNKKPDAKDSITISMPKIIVEDKTDPKNSDAFSFADKYSNKNNSNQFNRNNTQKRVYNKENGYTQKTFNNTVQKQNINGGQFPFNNQRQFNNQRSFDGANQQKQFANNRQFLGDRRQYSNGVTNNQNRPFVNNRSGNGFAASKANSFKSFIPLEDSKVLAQPEKTFAGKKAPVKSQYDEKKQMSKKALMKRGFIVDNSYNEDIDGVRMGSRKLVRGKKKETNAFVAPAIESAVITTETVTVKTLSEKTGKPVTEIIKKLMLLGIMATINSSIDFTTAELVCDELGVKLEQKIEKSYEEKLEESSKELGDNAKKRPPVVTVMGQVDHGKTSFLDAIRKTNVVSGEAGGITQKIGAYQVTWNNEKITFIDTPGHAAFTSMRARGAKVTDIAILVVAADDGIMPQTQEAIAHIKAANCPMVVAVNKMDKPEANVERVKQQLAENGVLPEEWGGDTIIVPISAKQGIGIDKLLENVLLVAEMQELKADASQTAVGVVIEAE